MPSSTDDLVKTIQALSPSAGDTVIVGIDGCGGAGKSTLAASLASQLSGAVIVHTDDFAAWDNPIDWWPRLLEQVLIPLSQSKPAKYQRYDWAEKRLAEWHDVQAPFVLLEGVTATRAEFRPFLAYKVWVECPRELRHQRGIERDGPAMEPLWQEWMRAEDSYCAAHRPRESADFIVDGATTDTP